MNEKSLSTLFVAIGAAACFAAAVVLMLKTHDEITEEEHTHDGERTLRAVPDADANGAAAQ